MSGCSVIRCSLTFIIELDPDTWAHDTDCHDPLEDGRPPSSDRRPRNSEMTYKNSTPLKAGSKFPFAQIYIFPIPRTRMPVRPPSVSDQSHENFCTISIHPLESKSANFSLIKPITSGYPLKFIDPQITNVIFFIRQGCQLRILMNRSQSRDERLEMYWEIS